jgi:hypothetical protein
VRRALVRLSNGRRQRRWGATVSVAINRVIPNSV